MQNLIKIHDEVEKDMLEGNRYSEPCIKVMQGITDIVYNLTKNNGKINGRLEIDNGKVTLSQFDIDIKKKAD